MHAIVQNKLNYVVVTISRNGAEQNGTELRSKIRNGTGLKCGTAKSRNMVGGAVTASTW